MCERVDAVDGKKLKKEDISGNLISSEGITDAYNKHQRVYEPLTQGGIGCALSHKKVYEKIIDDGIDKCLILEDDSKFDIDFFNKLKDVEKYIPLDFDMLFLGYHVSHIKKEINDYYFKPNKVYGLFGYIVSNQGAKKLLEMFPLTYQIDTEISNNMSNFNAYCVKPNYHVIYSDRSSVTTQFGTDIQIREGFGGLIFKNLIFFLIMTIIFITILFALKYL
jgi:glycosyl transferase family 25